MILGRATIGISISDPPDRAKLGFPQPEIDRALFSICTEIVRHGWDILYAGNLDPSGYTFKIFRHLAGAYASRRDAPFVHLVPEPVLRKINFDELRSALRESRGVVQTKASIGQDLYAIRLSGDDMLVTSQNGGRETIGDAEAFAQWLNRFEVTEPASAFRAARRVAAELSDARVALGGKMGTAADPSDRFEGAMPGVVEEAILMLEVDKPLVVLGAFGGATRDMAIALGLLDADQQVPRGAQPAEYAEAMNRVEALSGRIPEEHRAALRDLATDDRTEALAFKLVSLLAGWLHRPD